MTTYVLPLIAAPQSFSVTIGGTSYQMTLAYHNVDQGGWALDISDSAGNLLVCGIPLVTGADLLAQYGYLGIGGSLWVQSAGDPDAVPTFANLGTGSNVYLVTP